MYLLQAYSGSFPLPDILLILVIALIVGLIMKYFRTIDLVTNHGQTPFEELQFSTKEFYTVVEALITEKQIPGVYVGRVYHLTHGIFSGKREYLRVTYQRYFFDICAAPFAKDFFVSYRQGRLKVLVRRRREKTFYEIDTEAMFHGAILLCYQRAIERMIEKKGYRLIDNDPISLLQ